MNHYHGNIISHISVLVFRVILASKTRLLSNILSIYSPTETIYYSLIYPYLSYAVIAWGSAYKTHLQKLQSKQNTVLRLMLFATTSGPYTESALPFLNLVDILTIDNVYYLHVLKFTHLWRKGFLPKVFDNLFQYAKSRHTYNTREALKQNLCKPRMFFYQVIDLCHDIPH